MAWLPPRQPRPRVRRGQSTWRIVMLDKRRSKEAAAARERARRFFALLPNGQRQRGGGIFCYFFVTS